MTTLNRFLTDPLPQVVEAYRLDRYDNLFFTPCVKAYQVVEAYRLDRYDNIDLL